MFDLIVKEASNRFNLGDKALPLVQTLVAAISNKDTNGLTGFIESFRNKGLGLLVDSWLHSSAPLSINHAEIDNVLGEKGGLLETITAKVGLDKETTLMGLSYLLPNIIGKLASDGKIAADIGAEVTALVKEEAPSVVSNVGVTAAAAVISAAPVATEASVMSASTLSKDSGSDGLFDGLVEDIKHHFNLGDKAQSLVQTVVAAMTNNATGGLGGFIEGFKKHGLGHLTDSWLRDSYPLNINHAQIEEVLGDQGGLLETIVSKLGLDKGSALMGLGYLLPKLCQKLAPGGNIISTVSPDVSRFAENGLSLLGVSGAVAAAATMANSASSPIPEAITPASTRPIPSSAVESIPSPVSASDINSVSEPASADISAPKTEHTQTVTPVSVSASVAASELTPEPTPVVRPAPLAKTASASAPNVIAPEEPQGEGNIWKSLLWLLPVVLGLWLLKSCSHATDDVETNGADTSTASVDNKSIESSNADDKKSLDAANNATLTATPAPVAKANGETEKAIEPAPAADTSTPAPKVVEPEKQSAGQAQHDNDSSSGQDGAVDASVDIPIAVVYFELNKTALPADVKEKLAPVLTYLKTHKKAKVSISGFHDPSGNKVANDNLAKNRAKQVATKLVSAGIAQKMIVMEKPQSTTGTGSNEEARRVEVSVIQ